MKKTDGTNLEAVTRVLEGHGFHVTDVREERAISTSDNGHVIDGRGIHPTGAILLRVVPIVPSLD